jgi:hypothetical protein
MSKLKNGQYVVMNDERIVQYLGNDPEDALEYMMKYYRDNSSKRPYVYLLQVQAMLDYAIPTIKTMAHERMT